LPRDNVIFELGLFMGRFGRKRCFFFVDADSATEIASDLAGVKPVAFSRSAASGVNPSIERAAQALREQMLRQPPRRKFTERSREAEQGLWQFATCMKGSYWERMRDSEYHPSDDRSNDDVALSFVNVTIDEPTGTPKMEGKAFTTKGEPFGDWHSVTSSVVLGDQPRVLYYWEGHRDSTPGQIYGGGGYIQFDDRELVTAEAHHYDTNFAFINMPTLTRSRHVGIYRCVDDEIEVMKRPWTDEAKSLMASKLNTLKGR
jgi:hypothetical protein